MIDGGAALLVLDERRVVETIFSAERISERIEGLAGEIARSGLDDLVVVAILKGSFVFAADLLRALHRAGMAPEVDFLTLQSYHDATVSSGRVKVLRDIERDVAGRDVLIIDDILESGRTLAFARGHILARGARCVRTCVLLDKPVPRAGAIEADHRAFACPDVFVVGYGMDLANRYRELPFVGRIVERASG
ncbi:MAG: hypoxanthine phosphoribosyltransferase [Rhizobiales bacterium]|nr:hypoxanthine phosphoribosyltransferase [Hyphomicrobiales bacterium]